MKNNYIIYILILLWPSYDSFGQYLTLDGKQFKNSDGTSFYPKVCNYIVDLTYDSANNVFFIAPHGAYGTTPDYECLSQNNCLEWLQYDFHEMKQMGFNAIRIMGLFPSKSPHKIDNTTCPLDEKNYSKFILDNTKIRFFFVLSYQSLNFISLKKKIILPKTILKKIFNIQNELSSIIPSNNLTFSF